VDEATLDWLPALIRNRLATQLSRPVALPGMQDPAMYLHGSIGYDSAITINGDVWVSEYELAGPGAFQGEWRPARTKDRVGLLVIAARRIPELRVLLPQRSPESLSCTSCDGSGDRHFRGADGVKTAPFPGMICEECSGLGWIAG
jgi:hypothetical protein